MNTTPKAVTYTNVNVTGSEYFRVYKKKGGFLKWDMVVVICSGSTFGSNRSTCGDANQRRGTLIYPLEHAW